MTRPTRKALALFGALALVAVAAVATVKAASPHAAAEGPPSLSERFAELSQARSNRCNLTAAEVLVTPASQRLQGSCCFPMDFATYRIQLQKLNSYADVAEVPRDPYDIAARLAKTLTPRRPDPAQPTAASAVQPGDADEQPSRTPLLPLLAPDSILPRSPTSLRPARASTPGSTRRARGGHAGSPANTEPIRRSASCLLPAISRAGS